MCAGPRAGPFGDSACGLFLCQAGRKYFSAARPEEKAHRGACRGVFIKRIIS